MATVEIDDTPSEAVIKAAITSVVVADAGGRKIKVNKLKPSEKMRLATLVGPENAKNEAYMGYAALAFTVSEMDEEPVIRPTTQRQLEALVDRLGDDGLEAVGTAFVEHFGVVAPVDIGDEDKDLLKN